MQKQFTIQDDTQYLDMLLKILNEFDNSEYPENSLYFEKTNKKLIGKFKDEASGIPVVEFIGLRKKNVFLC